MNKQKLAQAIKIAITETLEDKESGVCDKIIEYLKEDGAASLIIGIDEREKTIAFSYEVQYLQEPIPI